MNTDPKFSRAAHITAVVSLLSVVMMGQRRPNCDTSVNPTIYGRGIYLSPVNQSVSFEVRATHDVRGGTGSLPALFTSAQTMVYVGDEDSLLYYFPTAPSVVTDPAQWLWMSYQVFGNHIAGSTLINGEQPPSMTGQVSAAPPGATQPLLIRQYDRGNCSWFVGAQSFGGILAQSFDSFAASRLTAFNQTYGSDIVLAATGVWHFRLAIDVGAWTQGQPPAAVSTTDRYEFFRQYYVWQVSGAGYDVVYVSHFGRLVVNASSAQVRAFVNLSDIVHDNLLPVTSLPSIQDGALFNLFKSYLIGGVYSQYPAVLGQRFAQEMTALSLPSPLRVSLTPSGPDVVVSEQGADPGDVFMSQHGQRSTYCGASRTQPVTLTGSPASRVGSGSFSWQSGWI